MSTGVLVVADIPRAAIDALLARYGLSLELQPGRSPITGSYWGESEAGIRGHRVFARLDTPLHSLLHEACHLVCMPAARRCAADTDAGGSDLEEAAVCYLQIVLAAELDGMGKARMLRDMDSWGYSFRLGDTASWFECDADDARAWLENRGLIDTSGAPTFALRG